MVVAPLKEHTKDILKTPILIQSLNSAQNRSKSNQVVPKTFWKNCKQEDDLKFLKISNLFIEEEKKWKNKTTK